MITKEQCLIAVKTVQAIADAIRELRSVPSAELDDKGRIMEDKNVVVLCKITYCYHPTDFDPIGSDGLYVKSIHKIESEIRSDDNYESTINRPTPPYKDLLKEWAEERLHQKTRPAISLAQFVRLNEFAAWLETKKFQMQCESACLPMSLQEALNSGDGTYHP